MAWSRTLAVMIFSVLSLGASTNTTLTPDHAKIVPIEKSAESGHEREVDDNETLNASTDITLTPDHEKIAPIEKSAESDHEREGDDNETLNDSSQGMSQDDSVEEDDVFDQSKLLPFYFYTITNLGKTVFTAFIFGFDVTFKEKTKEPPSWKTHGKSVLSILGRLVSTSLAINGWMIDLQKYQRTDGTIWHAGLCWVSSSNLPGAIALWYSIMLQRPSSLFVGLEPGYLNIAGIPVVPGRTKWLSWDKHLYALLLLPYFLPASPYIIQCISCAFYCAICVFFSKPVMCCFLWTVLVALSLALWAHAKDEVQHYLYGEMAWAFVMYVGIVFASVVGLVCFLPMVGCFFGRPFRESLFDVWGFLFHYIEASSPTDASAKEWKDAIDAENARENNVYAEVDWNCFRSLQDLSDFKSTNYELAPGDPVEQDVVPDESQISKAKFSLIIKIVDKNNDFFIYGQIMYITVFRMMLGTGFVEALSKTVGERHLIAYFHYISSVALMTVPEILDNIWKLL